MTIQIPAPLRRYSGEAATVEVEGETIGEALESLFGQYPDLRRRLLDDRDQLYPYLLLFHNNSQLPRSGFGQSRVAPGDTLNLVPAVGGGREERRERRARSEERRAKQGERPV